MADLSITAASVLAASGAITEQQTAGATITAGQTLYMDSNASNVMKLFDANASGTDVRIVYGIALNGASTGQPVTVMRSGDITIGATTAAGAVYVGSATPGGIAPVADLASGYYTNIIGIGLSATQIRLSIKTAGVAVP